MAYIRLSPYLCGYRKGSSSQQALLSLTENWKKILDLNVFWGFVLIDLSMAFDTIKNDRKSKLYVYDFNIESPKLP